MGLASFNRMRLRRIEAMTPEKIKERTQAEEAKKAPKGDPIATEEIAQADIENTLPGDVKEPKEEPVAKRGSKRK